MWLENIFYPSVVCLLSSYQVFHRAKVLHFDVIQCIIFSFFRMCFWCQSKSTSPSPRFQRFVLCLFSKSFSFTFYISVQGPLWVNCVRSVWVWGLARGSAPFVEMETFSPLNGPCILVRSQILFPGSLLCCTDLSVYPSPKATMAQTSYRVALTLGKLFSSFSKLPKLFWVLCLSL